MGDLLCDIINKPDPQSSSRVNIGLNPKKIASKGFIVLSASAGHGEFQKKVSINRTPGRELIYIFSKWPPMKPVMYY